MNVQQVIEISEGGHMILHANKKDEDIPFAIEISYSEFGVMGHLSAENVEALKKFLNENT